jgi:hypothetical protein
MDKKCFSAPCHPSVVGVQSLAPGLWYIVVCHYRIDDKTEAFTTGDIVSVKAFGQCIIILGSMKACIDLLDKRSHNYSDRPRFPMLDLYVTRT